MPQHRFLALTEHLPRHYIGVVFHGRDDDLVPLFHPRSRFPSFQGGGRGGLLPKGESQRIEAVRRALGEDDLVAALRSDELCYGLSCLFVFHRRYLAQMMHAAVDIAVPVAVSLSDSVYHRLRLLARSGVVKVHQRTSVNGLL